MPRSFAMRIERSHTCTASTTSDRLAGAPVLMFERGYEKPYFIVNQGPVYSGPGIYIGPWIKPFDRRLSRYPYVTHDYPYYHGRHR